MGKTDADGSQAISYNEASNSPEGSLGKNTILNGVGIDGNQGILFEESEGFGSHVKGSGYTEADYVEKVAELSHVQSEQSAEWQETNPVTAIDTRGSQSHSILSEEVPIMAVEIARQMRHRHLFLLHHLGF